MTGDAVVLSCSVIDLNDQRHCVEPNRRIVKHNDKQFVVEYKERTVRRYVQYYDDMAHKIRVFEVTDCIPYTKIQPYTHESQSFSKDDTSQNTLPYRSSRHSLPSPIVHNRLETTPSSNSINQRSLSKYIRTCVKCLFN